MNTLLFQSYKYLYNINKDILKDYIPKTILDTLNLRLNLIKQLEELKKSYDPYMQFDDVALVKYNLLLLEIYKKLDNL
jgi:hypothetical protein